MYANTFIRKYEVLKQKRAISIDELMNLEQEWIELYREMKDTVPFMSKKQKKETERFAKKTMDEKISCSYEIFYSLLGEGKETFTDILNKNEKMYETEGVRVLIESYLSIKDSDMTFNSLLELKRKEELLVRKTVEDWTEEVYSLAKKVNHTLQEAFQYEKTAMDLFLWWSKRKEEFKEDKEVLSVYSLLKEYRRKLGNYMLREMGYNFDIQRYALSERDWSLFYLKGIVSFIQMVEDNYGDKSPMIQELLSKIPFIHPRDEFRNVRSMKRHFKIHIGPTNSGKTYRAIQELKKAETGAYFAPIRLLASEIQEKMVASKIPCDLITGEGEIKMKEARHISSTIEMANFYREFDVAVIDEIQMIDDEKRGSAWLRAIFGIKAKEIHLCGAPHSISFVTKLIEECGDSYEIHRYERKTSLIVEKDDFIYPISVQNGDALIVFSKKRVLEVVKELQEKGIRASMIYGKLPPDARKKQVEMFTRKETNVIVSTDAIGIGLNLPIRRVVFLDTEKFDGVEDRPLTVQEVKQIAGRAGRKGHYEVGLVNSIANKKELEEKLFQSENSIEKSVISPSIRLASLEMGTLRQRLIAWKRAELDVSYLEKANIDEQLDLLKEIERWEDEFDSETIFKALYIPFRSEVRELRWLWIRYMMELKEGKSVLSKPKFLGTSLHLLEVYYQQVLLYYNFSKKFKLLMDKEWMEKEKKRVSIMINRLIQQKDYKNVI